jgi:hypothetical protein
VSWVLRLNGLEELKEWLRKLPDNLVGEATGIITTAANDAATAVIDRYPEVEGNLKGGVVVQPMRSRPGDRGGIGLVLRSKSSHAHLYEYGTQVRHTKLGWNRGRMPGKAVVTQEASKHRRKMYEQLTAMLVRMGFKVSGVP